MKHENLPTHSPFLIEGTRPPCCRHSDGRPVTRDGRPLTRDGRPATRDGRPVTRDGRPLTRDGHASAASRQVARYRRHRPSYVDEMLFGAPPACIPPHWQTGPCHGDDKDPLRGVSSYRRDSALIQTPAVKAGPTTRPSTAPPGGRRGAPWGHAPSFVDETLFGDPTSLVGDGFAAPWEKAERRDPPLALCGVDYRRQAPPGGERSGRADGARRLRPAWR